MEKQKVLLKNLCFKDEGLENEFESSKKAHQKLILVGVLCANFLFSFVTWLFNPFDRSRFELKIIIPYIINWLILIAAYVFSIKYFAHIQKVLALVVFYTTVTFCENNSQNKGNWCPMMNFFFGMMIQSLLVVVPLAKIYWGYSVFLSVFSVLYPTFRFLNFNEYSSNNFYPVFICLFYTLIVPCFCFILEKHDRIKFHELKNSEESLSSFKKLIMEVIPCSIIIATREEIVFKNKETTRCFNTEGPESFKEELKKINVNLKKEKFKSSCSIGYFIEEKEIKEINISNNSHVKPMKLAPDSETSTSNTLFNLIFSPYVYRSGPLMKAFSSYSGRMQKEQDEETDGTVRHLDIKISQIIWNNAPANIAIINEDQLLERMDYLQEQARYKDKLLATVSHDLRTPLNGMIGMLDSVYEAIDDKSIKKHLQLALRSSYLLLYMINDILDFSQISNGKLRLNFKKFSVMEVVKDVSKLIKFQAKRKGLKFYLENRIKCPKQTIIEGDCIQLNSDPNRLKQVLLNLMGNALKFTEKGHIKIIIESIQHAQKSLDIAETNDTPKGLMFKVEDTGCGIKKDDINKLFKLFGKLETRESKEVNQSGVGLGLAISDKLVCFLNGRQEGREIEVESEYGKGSCFSFKLIPDEKGFERKMSKEAEEELVNSSVNPIYPAVTNCGSYNGRHQFKKFTYKENINLLVVDDDQINIMVLRAFLDTMKFITYDLAFNGLEAVSKAKQGNSKGEFFEIIIMDINMPFMDGLEATRCILEMVAQKSIPEVSIIASTANASQVDHEKCFKAGMVDYISKPFTKAEFRKKIEEIALKKKNSDRVLMLESSTSKN